MATVIGPTPPGTGVIQAARSAMQHSKPTSPLIIPFASSVNAYIEHDSAGFDPFTRTLFPVCPPLLQEYQPDLPNFPGPVVNLWQIDTVAPANRSSRASGRPTIFEAPTITACWPFGSTSIFSSSIMMPYGVHGRRDGTRCASRPTVKG